MKPEKKTLKMCLIMSIKWLFQYRNKYFNNYEAGFNPYFYHYGPQLNELDIGKFHATKITRT